MLENLLADDLALVVKLVDDRNTGSELNLEDLLSSEALEGHDHGAEGVTVSGDQDLLSLLDAGEDLGLVVGEDTVGSELERLSAGRRNIERAAPDVDLLLSELLASCSRTKGQPRYPRSLTRQFDAPSSLLRPVRSP